MSNHQPGQVNGPPPAMQNNMVGGAASPTNVINGEGVYPLQNQQQLFLPGTMKMQVVARKSPAT